MSPPYERGDPRAKLAGSKGGKVTAHVRRAQRAAWNGTILTVMDHAGMTGPDWAAWRSFWCGGYGLPMTPEALALFQRHTKREQPPTAQVSEAWMVVGRRGGKSTNAALGAFFQGITADRRTFARDGEVVTIPLVARDRKQARQLLGYLRGFAALPLFRPYVHRGSLRETIELSTGINIEITSATRSGTRGYSSVAVVADEIAHWLDGDSNPAEEILTALRPTMANVPGSLLLALSNPFAPRGPLYDAVETYFGREDEHTLVWVADTASMRPSFDRRVIQRAYTADPVIAASEYGADGAVQFRQGAAALFDAEPVRQCIVIGRHELPPTPGLRYVGFCDAAQGQRSGDSMTLAVAHGDGTRAVLDLLREVEPPFDPALVVQTFAAILREYDIREVQGDRVSLGFVLNEFASAGITFVPSPLTKSDLFGELLPLINTARVELLDHPRLLTQLLALERRAVRGGRDNIDHPRGAHDDCANAAAGALVQVTGIGQKKKRLVRILSAPLRYDEGGSVRVGSNGAGLARMLFT